jgi:hypothetical protein
MKLDTDILGSSLQLPMKLDTDILGPSLQLTVT